jgi:hypothetical protein
MTTFAMAAAEYITANSTFAVACEGIEGKEFRAAERRRYAAVDAMLAARPTDPRDMAQQLQMIAVEAEDDLPADRFVAALRHIADQLEAMARRATA